MAPATRTFRIFVSSTFSDLKAERNALQKYVFPRLRELCARHGCRFQAIDLRWGVREEAALDQQTMRICLEEIARCQRVTPKPNFIVLLGDRYGWRPLPFEIPADEFEAIEGSIVDANAKALVHRWYKRDDNAVPPVYDLQPREGEFKDSARWEAVERWLRGILVAATAGVAPNKRLKYFASATEQEIVLGAMDVADAAEHVLGFFRSIKDLPHDRSAQDFIDIDEHGQLDAAAHDQLRKLKKRLRSLLPGNIHDYEASWQNGAPTTDHVGALPAELDECLKLNEQPDPPRTLCVDVWRRLAQVILDQTAQIEAEDALDRETRNHSEFGQKHTHTADGREQFVGRQDVLRAIDTYIKDVDRHPLVIHGESGSGKTAVIARATEQCEAGNQNCVIIRRFIGATPGSSDGRTLIEGLCREISRRYGADDSDVPAEYQELVGELPRRLALATSTRRLVLFLDALDQLSDADHARNLAWLPPELPEHVRLIVTTVPGDCLDTLHRKLPGTSFVTLDVMRRDEAAQLLDLWLDQDQWRRRARQRDQVLDAFAQVGLPLYLRLAFEEARRWKSYPRSTDKALRASVDGIIHENLLDRLSSEHGTPLVSRALGYLCAARRGLSEDEMLDVLSSDTDVFTDFRERAQHDPPEQRLPVIVWSRLYFDLEPYLTERDAHGTPVLNFYHRQFGEAAAAAFLNGDGRAHAHSHLAEYFQGQDYFRETLDAQRTRARTAPPTPRPVNVRKVDELPWQRLEAAKLNQKWEELEELLTDLFFVEAKAEAGRVFDLASDFASAINLLPPSREEHRILQLLQEALSRDVQFLASYPTTLFQCFWNSAWWYDCPEAAPHYEWEAASIPEPLPWQRAGTKLSTLLESWKLQKTRRTPRFKWLKSHRPPAVPLGSGQLRRIRVFSEAVAVSAHPDGHLIACAGSDGTIRIFQLSNGEEVTALRGHDGTVTSVAFAPDGKLLASGGNDGTVRIWDTSAYYERRVLRGHGVRAPHRGFESEASELLGVTSVAFAPDGRTVASGGADGSVRIWNVETGSCSVSSRREGRSGVLALAFSPEGSRLAWSACVDGIIRITDLTTLRDTELIGHEKSEDRDEMGPVKSLAFSPQGKKLASAGSDRTIRLWNIDTGEQLATLEGHDFWIISDVTIYGVASVAFSPDGTRLVSGGYDGTLRLWSLAGDASCHVYRDHHGPVNSVTFSTDGQSVFSASSDGTLCVRRLAGFPTNVHMRDHESKGGRVAEIIDLVFSQDGRKLASSGGDYVICIWDVETGRQGHALRGHLPARPQDLNAAGIGGLAFALDGCRLASAGDDGTVRIWDTELGLQLGYARVLDIRKTPRATGLGGPHGAVAFSPDGRFLAFAGESGVLVWNLEESLMAELMRRRIQDEAKLGSLLRHMHRALSFENSNYGTIRKAMTKSDEMRLLEEWAVMCDLLLREPQQISAAFSPPGRAAFSPDSRLIVVALAGRGGWLLSTTTRTASGEDLTQGDYCKIEVFDVQAREQAGTLSPPRRFDEIVFSPDSRFLAATDLGEIIALWDTHTFQPIKIGTTTPDLVASPDGAHRFPFRLRPIGRSSEAWLVAGGETIVEDAPSGVRVASYSELFVKRRRHPCSGDVWAGGDRTGHLHIISLEEAVPAESRAESAAK